MPEMLRIFLGVLILTISFVAYFLVTNALFPQRVGKTKEIIQSMPGRSFGIGFVNFAFFFVIAFVLLAFSGRIQNGIFKSLVMIPALIVLAVMSILLTFGLTAMSSYLGERIIPEAHPSKQTVWGTVCLCFGCALPFVGWFLLFPYIGFVGIGAFILGVFQKSVVKTE